jgi:hypothetical protein
MNRRLQLEMPLETNSGPCRSRAPRRRMTRARWWFSQMHLAVEQASDWEPLDSPAGKRTGAGGGQE